MSGEIGGQVIPAQGSSRQELRDQNEGIRLRWTLEWLFRDNNLVVSIAPEASALNDQITIDGPVEIRNVRIEYSQNQNSQKTTIEGIRDEENDSMWLFSLPEGFSMAGILSVVCVARVTKTELENQQQVGILATIENQLVADRFPALIFQMGLDGFIVLRNEERREYRFAQISSLDRIANVRNGQERLYRWEDCTPMGETHYNNLAVLSGVSGLLEGMAESDENIGKQFLDEQFQDMKSKNEDSRVIVLNGVQMTVVANLRGGIEFFLPDPGENYRSAQRERDRLFSPTTSGTEKVVAMAGMFGYAVFTVVDFVPVLGKADNAVAALRHGDEMASRLLGRMERELAQTRRLANSDRFSQEAREMLSRSGDEMQQQIEALRKLRDDLNAINNVSPEEAARLQEAMTNLESAQRYRDRVGRQVMRDFNEGAANAVETMQRRADIQRTIQNIMNSMPTEAARARWRQVAENLTDDARRQLDEDRIIEYLRSTGQLTEQGIDRFGRNAANLYSEVGKVELRDRFRLGPIAETRDLGFEGKRFEEIITDNAEAIEIGQDLNQIRHNFEVVDYVTRVGGRFSEGKIYSIARGGPQYLLEKIDRLFNRLTDADNTRKFRNMLEHLSRNDVLSTVGPNPTPEDLVRLQDEFLERAYLFVPSDVEGPLKVLIMSRNDIPLELRERMANAVTSEMRR